MITINEFEANNIVIALTFIEKVLTAGRAWDYLEKQELLEPNMDHLSESCKRQRKMYVKNIKPVKRKFESIVKQARQIMQNKPKAKP